MNGYRHFSVELVGDVSVVQLTSLELMDRIVTNELQDDLVTFVEEQAPQKVVINFDRLRRCSTEIINAMLRARKRLASHGGALRLCSLRPPIRDVFRLLNLEGSVFDIYDRLDEALKGF